MNYVKINKWVKSLFTDNIVWLLLMLALIIGIFIDEAFFTGPNLLNIISHAAPLTMMVFGMSLLLMLGRIDLSMESTYALAPILGNLFVMKWFPHLPDFLSIIICLGIGSAIGLFNGMLSIKYKINDFLVGLSMSLFLRGVVKVVIPEGLYNLPDSFTFMGSKRLLGNEVSLSVIIMLIVFFIMHFFTKYRPFGRQLLATGSNREAAFIGGINTKKIQMTAFGLSGLFAAFGGMLTAGRQLSCTNGMGEGSIMRVLAAVVLGGISMNGGKGAILGALGGALLLQTIDNILTLSAVSPFYQDAIFGFILLSAIVFQGIRIVRKKKI